MVEREISSLWPCHGCLKPSRDLTEFGSGPEGRFVSSAVAAGLAAQDGALWGRQVMQVRALRIPQQYTDVLF
eukprot:scaffold45582_cov18-Prasinocladus_malaysianus.AAC.1